MANQSTLSRSDLQKMSGASPSTISRALRNGIFSGAYRHDGLHWSIPMTPSVAAWCRDQKRRQKLLTLPKGELNEAVGRGTAYVTIEGLSMSFDLWKRKTKPKVEGWNITQLDKAILLLEPFAEFLESLRTMRKGKTARILR